jgi:mersacidin/lichenicidin family type 2 lantibiotic
MTLNREDFSYHEENKDPQVQTPTSKLAPEILPSNPEGEAELGEAELDAITGGLNPQPIPPGQRLPKTYFFDKGSPV